MGRSIENLQRSKRRDEEWAGTVKKSRFMSLGLDGFRDGASTHTSWNWDIL